MLRRTGLIVRQSDCNVSIDNAYLTARGEVLAFCENAFVIVDIVLPTMLCPGSQI